MDPQVTLAEVRKLITEAKNEKAANLLLAYLAVAPEPVRSWRNTVSNLLAQYKRVRLQRERGMVGFDNARLTINQITDGLLVAVAAIEAGRPVPLEKDQIHPSKANKIPWLAIGVVIALVLAGVSFLMWRNLFRAEATTGDNFTVQEGEVEAGECPDYDEDSQFNVLVLPFLALDNKPSGVDRSIRIRLAERMEKYGVYGNVYTKHIETTSNNYPITSRQAADLARPCDAQLIIWGTTEEASNQDGYYTTTKFRFVESETFSLANLELRGSAEVDTVSNLSSIATSAELTETVEKTLRLIFGLVAHETENYALAADLLDTVIAERGGVAANPKWGVIQADSYIKSGQNEKAIEVYEKMTVRGDSLNVQALLNKGILQYKGGQTMAATKDLTAVLEYEPDNEKALTARAVASLEHNDLYQADQDLDKLEKMPEQDTTTKRIREEYNQRYRKEKRKLAVAGRKIDEDPNDTTALRMKAESAHSLGYFRQAELAASTLLQVDPSSVAALKTLQAVSTHLPDSLEIQRRLRSSGQLRTQQVAPGGEN